MSRLTQIVYGLGRLGCDSSLPEPTSQKIRYPLPLGTVCPYSQVRYWRSKLIVSCIWQLRNTDILPIFINGHRGCNGWCISLNISILSLSQMSRTRIFSSFDKFLMFRNDFCRRVSLYRWLQSAVNLVMVEIHLLANFLNALLTACTLAISMCTSLDTSVRFNFSFVPPPDPPSP